MTHHFRTTVLYTIAVITIVVACGCGSTAAPAASTPAAGTSSAGSAGASGSATATAPAPAAPAATPAAPGTPAQTTGLPAGYLPMFPFASLADVRAWQASYESGGHQPWHRSPDLTATAFLGYTDVTQVAHSAVSGGDAHVAVGIKLPDGTISTAAIIHLVLFGSGTYAPWEVVGTDDRTFTMDRPAYGGTAPSPVTVGGTIAGVDESIRVTVHTLSAQAPVGAYCCRAAGGTRSPWSARVTFAAAPGQVITIAAATGGHVAAVERFAVTGARAG